MDDRYHNYHGYLPDEERERIYNEMLNPEGISLDIKEFTNLMTGEAVRFIEANITRYNPVTEAPEIIDRHVYPTGIDGNPILHLQEAAICHVGGELVSRLQSVTDPFCGRNTCLIHSEMVELEEGLIFRVCKECAKAIRWKQFKKKCWDFVLRRGK